MSQVVGTLLNPTASLPVAPTTQTAAVPTTQRPATATATATQTKTLPINQTATQTATQAPASTNIPTTKAAIPTTTSTVPTTTLQRTTAITHASSGTNIITITKVVSPSSAASSTSSVGPSASGTSFLANKNALTGVFTVVGVAGTALAVYLLVRLMRRRHTRRVEREADEAAADVHQVDVFARAVDAYRAGYGGPGGYGGGEKYTYADATSSVGHGLSIAGHGPPMQHANPAYGFPAVGYTASNYSPAQSSRATFNSTPDVNPNDTQYGSAGDAGVGLGVTDGLAVPASNESLRRTPSSRRKPAPVFMAETQTLGSPEPVVRPNSRLLTSQENILGETEAHAMGLMMMSPLPQHSGR
ncbi:hypothetical protein C8R43DRAFT_1201582 [Mycena crocata]|nr:hypothetical protein C8R43DRAFT_1201582 [Mycena crocata]